MVVIGIDTHIATCDFYAVNSQGKCLKEGTIQTSVGEFKGVIGQFKKSPVTLVIEQGPLTDWMVRTLKGSVARIVVSETRRNRWIANDNIKNDRFDAEKLARLCLGGFIKEVIQRNEKNEELLRVVLLHHDLVKQRTQIKNKIKAKYRQDGIWPSGAAIFTKSNREEWISKISNPHLLWPVDSRFKQLDLLDDQIEKTDKLLCNIAKQYPIIGKLSKKFPGIGLINASSFVALIDTPFRFATVKKLWTYCGLGLDKRGSGQKPGTPRLTKRGNRLLKGLMKQAVTTAINSKENKYRNWYQRAVEENKLPYKVKLSCTRKLVKDMWLCWMMEVDQTSIKISS